FSAQIVRYVPGNVWHLLGRVYLAGEKGVPAEVTSASLVLELLQSITAALVVAAMSLPFWPQAEAQGLWILLVLPLLAAYAFPGLFVHRPLGWVSRRTGFAASTVSLRRRDLFALLPGYCGTWLLFGCGLYLLGLSVHPLPARTLPAFVGIFAVA